MAAAQEPYGKTEANGGGDAIYAEASCQLQDMLYEGSEDEQYEAPSVRRFRYEEAGRRFLAGGVPLLLSASLNGPFDSRSGWINPWLSGNGNQASKNVTNRACVKGDANAQNKTSNLYRPTRDEECSSAAATCHLPSPESLKQALHSKSHLFLGRDELNNVIRWRRELVHPPSSRHEFWSSASSDISSPRKRRKVHNSERPIAQPAKKQRSDIKFGRDVRVKHSDVLDEVTADTSLPYLDPSVASAASKKIPTKASMGTSKSVKAASSENECASNKVSNAAMLSSPVSMRADNCKSSAGETTKHGVVCTTSSVATQTTPSRLRHINLCTFLDVEAQSAHGIELSTTPISPSFRKAIPRDRDSPERFLESRSAEELIARADERCVNDGVDGNHEATHAMQVSLEDVAEPPGDPGTLEHVWVEKHISNTNVIHEVKNENMEQDRVFSSFARSGSSSSNTADDACVISRISERVCKIHKSQSERHTNGDVSHEQAGNGADGSVRRSVNSDNDNCQGLEASLFTKCVQSQGEAPMTFVKEDFLQDSATMDRDDFSFKGLLSRFIPAAPWTRLSQVMECAPVLGNKSGQLEAEDWEETTKDMTDRCKEINSPLTGAQSYALPVETSDDQGERQDASSAPTQGIISANPPKNASDAHIGVLAAVLAPQDITELEAQRCLGPTTRDDCLRQAALAATSARVITDDERGAIEHKVDTGFEDQQPGLTTLQHQITQQEHLQEPTDARERTPEPHFSCKTFASFMSPSPIRSHQICRLHQGSPFRGSALSESASSILRTRRSRNRSKPCVTWATSLVEAEGAVVSQRDDANSPTCHSNARNSSPPPSIPIAGSIRLEDDRFSKHFQAVVNRAEAQGEKSALRITEHENHGSRTDLTSETMMKTKENLDDERTDEITADRVFGRASEEPMDVAEDIFRSMGDFWDSWNIDAELDSARRSGISKTSSRLWGAD